MNRPPQTLELPERGALEPWVARALDAARAEGASAAEASVSVSRGLTVNVRNGEVESLEFQRDRSLGLTAYFGRRTGSASTADLSDNGLAETVRAACAIAAASGEDPCAGLADPALLAKEFPDLDLSHPWRLAPEEAIEHARRCEAAALAVDARITRSEGAALDTHEDVWLYANTHGFVGERRGTDHQLSCGVVAEDRAGMQRDYDYDVRRSPRELAAPEAVGRRAGERAVARLSARKLATRSAPVLMTPEVARGLLGHFVAAISGGALYRRASFLLDCAGKTVFNPRVTLEQKPFIARAAASRAFDNEGVATAERVLVERGVLQSYLLGSYAARKLGLQSTGNAGGVFNLVARPTAGGFDALVREMGEGLVVTELMGQGVNLMTGDYSRGAAGFWVESGAIAHPVQEVTIAGNLADIFRGVVAIGDDVDTRGGIRCGSILIERMTVAGH